MDALISSTGLFLLPFPCFCLAVLPTDLALRPDVLEVIVVLLMLLEHEDVVVWRGATGWMRTLDARGGILSQGLVVVTED